MSKVVSFRVSEDLYSLILRLCGEYGLKVSDFLERLLIPTILELSNYGYAETNIDNIVQ